MPNLYIANCSKQDQDFHYRTSRGGKTIIQLIRVGSQIKISGDLTGAQIAYIVQQHEKYGFANVKDIDRSKDFVGVCYDEKPISVEAIRHALSHNDLVLLQRGRKSREEAAVAAHQTVQQQLEGAANLEVLDVEIEEEKTDKTEGDPLRESVSVDTKADARTETSKDKGKGKNKGKNR